MEHEPVQRVVFHAEVVPGEVARRVAQIMVLVPQHPLAARRRRYNLHLNGQFDRGGQLSSDLRLESEKCWGLKLDKHQKIINIRKY